MNRAEVEGEGEAAAGWWGGQVGTTCGSCCVQALLHTAPPITGIFGNRGGGISAYQLRHPINPKMIPLVASKPHTLGPMALSLPPNFPFLC